MLLTGEGKAFCAAPGAKASPNRAPSRRGQTRNPVIYPWTGRSPGKTGWRAEPPSVEKLSDDTWVGVKGQSNREIARTPRNVFGNSVVLAGRGGRATDRTRGSRILPNPDELRMPRPVGGSEGRGAKAPFREGKNPDPPLRPLNAA